MPARAESWFADYAALPTGLARDVRFDVADGRFASVTPGAAPEGARRLPGVVLPGFANCHSHAFHRALRGRTHDAGGSFWTWRERMYAVADRLDPDTYLALARAGYAEMALSGITSVGEFHYLHHGPGGRRYDDPNAMAEALRAAAADAGIRLTLLDTLYLAGGLDASGYRPLEGTQRRFGDQDADAWAQRVARLSPSEGMRVGVAAHSIRAVPPQGLQTVATVSAGRPLHVHLSEQPAENEACLAAHGCTPTRLLAESGVLARAVTAVHATHLTAADIAELGGARATACFCPTTERDLADGVGPAARLQAAGSRLSLGSDQHAVVDLLEEARALELHERLVTGRRGVLPPEALLAALTGHPSIGWHDAGRLATGSRADLVAVRLDTTRTAGCRPEQVIYCASAADIDTVVVDGRVIVESGAHRLGDVAALLQKAIDAVMP